MEQALFKGELMAVAATNALELGVDIGSLDMTLHLGFPGRPPACACMQIPRHCTHHVSCPALASVAGAHCLAMHISASAYVYRAVAAAPFRAIVNQTVCLQAQWPPCGSRLAGQGGVSRPPRPSTSPLTGPWISTTSSTPTSFLGAPLSTARCSPIAHSLLTALRHASLFSSAESVPLLCRQPASERGC